MSIPNHVMFKLIYHLILLLQLPDSVPTLKRCRGKVWKWQEQRSLHTQYPCRIRSGSILVTASYGHYGQRAATIGPDRICRIRLPASVFPKKAWAVLCKTDPDSIWMAWPGFGQTHVVWKLAGVQESSGPVSGRTQPTRYEFRTFRLGSVLPQTSQII